MKKQVLVLAALVMAMTATTLKAQLNVGSTSAPITTLDVQGNSYIRGNLGVGISAPGSKLHVAADAAAYGGQFAIGGVSNVNQQLQMGFNTATNQGYLQATVAGSTYNDLLLNPFAGNVGIGNTTPYAPLAFGNYTTNKKISLYGASNDNLFYGFGVTGGVLSYQVDNISASHVFYAAASATASNELMRITGAGNVGINTNSPQQKLEVNAANNPVRFSNLASTTSTTNILAIDASGDIRSIPATSVATGSTSAWSQVTAANGYGASGNENIIMIAAGNVGLPVPTAAQIGHSIMIISSGGSAISLVGSAPISAPNVRLNGITAGQRIIITAINSSLYASGAYSWLVTSSATF